MGWLVSLIVGGVAGWLASMVMNRDASMGIIMNVVVGVIGGLIGSAIGANFFAFGDGWINYLITAFIGAVILLGIVNLIQRGRVR